MLASYNKLTANDSSNNVKDVWILNWRYHYLIGEVEKLLFKCIPGIFQQKQFVS